jgi:endonuclease YncB( thermonuclease family)
MIAGLAFTLGIVVGAAFTAPSESRAVRHITDDPSSPRAVRPAATRGLYWAEVLNVLDGDTFEALVHVWPGIDVTTKVRLRGIDAPELKARCSEERAKAEAARDALRSLLGEGEVAVSRATIDKYGGRVVADASVVRSGDVSTAMIAKGHARSYDGGRRETWCTSRFGNDAHDFAGTARVPLFPERLSPLSARLLTRDADIEQQPIVQLQQDLSLTPAFNRLRNAG